MFKWRWFDFVVILLIMLIAVTLGMVANSVIHDHVGPIVSFFITFTATLTYFILRQKFEEKKAKDRWYGL